MNWEQLLSSTRLNRVESHSDCTESSDARSEFQRDYDRIVFSSAFRRLQDKTQVFPLAESDYVRTRLTHSIEVSCVGRSLGTLAGCFVKENYPDEITLEPQEFGNIVAAACLAHDIGNPPFGHSGEEAIRNWFVEGRGKEYLNGLSEKEQSDFVHFEGNAQGFRILTRLQSAIDRGGLQLSYAVLGTFSKYPRCSYLPNFDESGKVSEKKFGFITADAGSFEKIAEGLGLPEKQNGAWSRHPLAFLMEAADDICYRIIDLEDGYRIGRVSFCDTKNLLIPILSSSEEDLQKSSYGKISDHDEKGKIEYLRAKAINRLIFAAIDVFKNNYKNIMSGKFESDLVSNTECFQHLEKIKIISRRKVYDAPNVLYIESAGFEVLGGLLEKIVPALVKPDKDKTPAEKKIKQIIPFQYTNGLNKYEQLLYATDFISGMTDSYAVTLYRRLLGIELPRG